jgi:Uma2 family endonuclease
MAMTIADVEKVQRLFPDYRIELRDGVITIMSPSDAVSGIVGVRLSTRLNLWVEQRALGYIFDASTGFRPPNTDLTAPDVSFVSRERLGRAPRTYAQVVPNLVAEIKSSTDRLKVLEEKLLAYLAIGAEVGLLLDPDKRTVGVYRPGRLPEVLSGTDSLRFADVLPGWEVPVSELWPPVFD